MAMETGPRGPHDDSLAYRGRVQSPYPDPGGLSRHRICTLETFRIPQNGALTMGLVGLVELTSDLPRETLERLALGAYHASRAGPVGLALTGLGIGDVDPLLDAVVRTDPRTYAGVRYLAGNDADTVSLAAAASFVVATSTQLQDALDVRGVPWLDASDGLRLVLHPRTSRYPRRPAENRSRRRGDLATR